MYIRFTKSVHFHYHTRVFTLPNTCIFVIKYAYPHYQLRVFISPRTHLCITIPIYSFFVIYNIEYKTPQYSIYIHVNCINCFLGYFLIKIQNRALHSTLYICMHPNFVLTSGRNCFQLSSLFPAQNPDLFHPFTVFIHRMGKKTRAHRIFTPRNCTKLCMDRIICSHASHSIRTPFVEIALHSLRIRTTLSQKSHCLLLEFAPPIRRNHVAFSQNLHPLFVEIVLCTRIICIIQLYIVATIFVQLRCHRI